MSDETWRPKYASWADAIDAARMEMEQRGIDTALVPGFPDGVYTLWPWRCHQAGAHDIAGRLEEIGARIAQREAVVRAEMAEEAERRRNEAHCKRLERAWTVSRLREELARYPDDMLVLVPCGVTEDREALVGAEVARVLIDRDRWLHPGHDSAAAVDALLLEGE